MTEKSPGASPSIGARPTENRAILNLLLSICDSKGEKKENEGRNMRNER